MERFKKTVLQRILKRSSHILFAVCLTILMGVVDMRSSYAANISPLPEKNILILHSDEEFIPANIDINQVFGQLLKQDPTMRVNLYSEYLDLRRFYDEKAYNNYVEILKTRYAEKRPDIVITVDIKAYKLAQTELKDVLKGVPLVFCMLPDTEASHIEKSAYVTGNFMNIDGKGTADLILKVNPNTKRIVLIAGAAPADETKLVDVQGDLKDLPANIELSVWKDKSIDELKSELKALSEDTAVIYVSIFQDSTGKVFIPREALKQLSEVSPVPIYGIFYTNVEYGLAGGSLFEFKEVARDASEKALAILRGTPPTALKIEKVTNTVYMNWNYMKQWGIKARQVPKDVTILHREYSFWETYKNQILGILMFITIETLLILFLLYQLKRRKSAEGKLEELNTELEDLVDARTAALVQAHQDLLIAEKHNTLNKLIRNLLHRINTPLGNNKTYMEMLMMELKEESQGSDELFTIAQNMKVNQSQLINVMDHMKTMLEIDSREEKQTADLYELLSEIFYDNFASTIEKSKTIVLLCYPQDKLTIPLNNFKIAISSMMLFAKQQRMINKDLPPAEILLFRHENSLEIKYVDGALNHLDSKEDAFDPFQYNNFKSSPVGMELTILYNTITLGLGGEIRLGSVENGDHCLEISVPLPLEESLAETEE